MGQSFAEAMGFAEHPWVMVRHGADHVHMVVFRVSDASEVWHGRNDRRAAQSACTRLELEHGLEQAPRRRVEPNLSVIAEREQTRAQELALVSHRAVQEAERIAANKLLEAHLRIHRTSFPYPPMTWVPGQETQPVLRVFKQPEIHRDQGIERQAGAGTSKWENS